MDIVEIMSRSISHNIDCDVIRKLCEESEMEQGKIDEIERRLNEKYTTSINRQLKGLTNEIVHEKNGVKCN